MNYKEALTELASAVSVRRNWWPDAEYLFLDGTTVNIQYQFGEANRYVPSDLDIDAEDWEIYNG